MNINNSERDKEKLSPSYNTINKQRSTSKTQQTQSTINDIPTKTDEENDDCFIKFGFISSSKQKNQQINETNQKQNSSRTQIEENKNTQNQPAHLVEEINAIISLIIYDNFSKKHKFKFTPQHQTKNITSSNYICDDIDRFDAIYSCLIDQFTSIQHDTQDNHLNKSNLLRNYLCDRFFTLSNIKELKNFIYKEKKN